MTEPASSLTIDQVTVPAKILMTTDLSQSAKLVWMFLQLPLPEESNVRTLSGQLHAWSRLSRPTVKACLSELARGDWFSQPKSPHKTSATVPIELLMDRHLKIREKLLYATLQLAPGFRKVSGKFTYSRLSAVAGVGVNTSKRAVRMLRQAGWLTAASLNKSRSIHFTLSNPVVERCKQINRRYRRAQHKGETLMREYLNVIVAIAEYADNASLSYLINPYTGAALQFDRYYPPAVAFEFQGPQHYGATELYPDEDDANKQRARDHMKVGICRDRGIELLLVHPEELEFAVMLRKVQAMAANRLPLRDLNGLERIITCLDELSRTYRENSGNS